MLPSAKFESFISQNGLFEKNDRVLLAISGGRDSVLLAHLLHQGGYNFALAHINFQLRGAESDGDENFCRDLAAQLSVPFFSTCFDTLAFANTQSLSIQMAARHLRYDWLEQIRSENQFAYIATAHHQNDSVETVLLNLVRGTGISGLHGILPKRGCLVRPLLCFTREEVTIAVANLPYRDDSSNATSKYARNKLRLEVIPKLKELNPSLEETFAANQRRMAELEEMLQLQIAALHLQLFRETCPGIMEIPLPALQALKPLNTLLFELFRPYGFTEAVLADLTATWEGQPGKIFSSQSHQILLDREKLLLSPLKLEELLPVVITAGQKHASWGSYNFRLKEVEVMDFQLKKAGELAQFDAAKLVFPLLLRSWEIGDVFQPLGLKGQKKLSDFFIEHKTPLWQKKQIPVVQNGNGEIIWIAGMRLDERYKVTENTKKVFIFEQHQHYV